MAEKPNSTVLTVQVGGANVDIDSIGKATKALRALKGEALSGSEAAKKAYADLKDKIEDVNDATNTLKGSGVEKLNNSFRLLSDGFSNFDGDKIKTAFQGIGAAMKAIPIFLLIEGIRLVAENFPAIISAVKDFIGVTSESEQAVKRLNDELESQKENLDAIAFQYQRAAVLSAAAGAKQSEVTKLLIADGEARLNALKEEEKTLYALLEVTQKSGENSDEVFKKISENEKNYSNLLTNTAKLYIDLENQKAAEQQKISDESDKKRKAAAENRVKENKHLIDEILKAEAVGDEFRKQQLEDQKAYDQSLIDSNELFKQLSAEQNATEQRNADERIKLNEQVAASKITNEKNAFQGAKDLSEAFLNFQLAKADGDVAKQNELAKKAFQLNKALQLAQGGLEAYRSVLSTYAATPGGVIAKTVAASIAGAASAAMLLKIASVKFKGQDEGGQSATNTSAPTIASTPNAPQLNSGNGGTSSTIINNNGSLEPLQAFVVEGQSRAVTDRINRIRRSSTFG